jgi:hypothetical protein
MNRRELDVVVVVVFHENVRNLHINSNGVNNFITLTLFRTVPCN